MKISRIFLGVMGVVLAFPAGASAAKLADAPGFEYDVKFTNPKCHVYRYRTPVESVSGKMLVSKPQDVFCTYADEKASGSRPNEASRMGQ